jgi:hypothetical protein
VIVVGSQSILGTYREEDLPAEATMSVEVDILPIADDNAETARLADLIEGVAGEFSPFEDLHGFSLDTGSTWRPLCCQIAGASGSSRCRTPTRPRLRASRCSPGWCLDKEDLCVAKLCALREKDQNFVAALLDAQLADVAVITERLAAVPGRHRLAAERAIAWLGSRMR